MKNNLQHPFFHCFNQSATLNHNKDISEFKAKLILMTAVGAAPDKEVEAA